MNGKNNRREDALEAFLETWQGALLSDIASQLSCIECNALAELLRACGQEERAETLLNAHAEKDEDGDDEQHLERKHNNAQDELRRRLEGGAAQ